MRHNHESCLLRPLALDLVCGGLGGIWRCQAQQQLLVRKVVLVQEVEFAIHLTQHLHLNNHCMLT